MLYVRKKSYINCTNIATSKLIKTSTNWQSRGLCLVSCFDLWNPLEKRPILWNSSPRLYLEYPKPMYHDYGCDCVSPVAQPMELEKPRRLGVVPTGASVVVVQGVSSDSPAFHLENATWAILGIESWQFLRGSGRSTSIGTDQLFFFLKRGF